MTNKIIAFPKTLAMLKQAKMSHEEYLKIITDICEYEITAYKIPMPALNFPPSDIDEFVLYRQNIIDALDYWNKHIYSSLEELPKDVQRYLNRLCSDTTAALGWLDEIDKCVDEDYYNRCVKKLLYSLEDMMDDVEKIKGLLNDLVESIVTYQEEKLTDAYNNMHDLVERLRNDKNVDQEQVNKLLDDIHQLNKEIESAKKILEASVAITGASVAVFVIGVCCCGKIGAIVFGIFAGIPALIGITGIALNSKKIEALEIAIDADQSEMDLYNLDIVALQNMDDDYTELMDGMSALRENVSSLYDLWAGVAVEIKDIYDWIDTHNEEGEIKNWAEMREGLTGIISTSKEISETMEIVDISDIQVSTASIELGMSEEEVKEAVNSAEKLSFLEYIKVV